MNISKSAVAFAMILIPMALNAQIKTTLDDFLGLKWGASSAEIKKVMLAREGVTLDKEMTKEGMLAFDGGKFAGKSVQMTVFVMSGDKMNTAAILFEKPLAAKLLDTYRDIQRLLIEKYGNPHDDFEFYTSPYKKGDGDETLAISVGKGTVASFWVFPVAGQEDNSITLEVQTGLTILLKYENGTMKQEYIKQKESKEKGDL